MWLDETLASSVRVLFIIYGRRWRSTASNIILCVLLHQHSFRMSMSVRNSPATLWYMKASPVVGLTRKLSPLGEALISGWSKQPTTSIMAIPLDEALLYCVAFGSLLFGTVLKPCIASRHFWRDTQIQGYSQCSTLRQFISSSTSVEDLSNSNSLYWLWLL